MKVEVAKVHKIWPRSRHASAQSDALPLLDAWYAYRRTVPTIYLFKESINPQRLVDQLVESLSMTLDAFPRFIGTLETTPIDGVQRTLVTWGHSSDQAVELTEAHTKARIHELLPSTRLNESEFFWDYTPASLSALFPVPSATPPGIRVQVTGFACGGFSLGIDFEHGLADGYTAGRFLEHWSVNFEHLFHGGTAAGTEVPSWQSRVLRDSLAEINLQDEGPALLAKARMLPTRTPYRRTLEVDDAAAIHDRAPTKSFNYVFHIPATKLERTLKDITSTSSIRLTDQAALIGFFWACLNRARERVGQPPLDLHLANSFRWLLGHREGLLGSPFVVVMTSPNAQSNPYNATDPIRLAAKVTETLSQYDDNAMHAIVHDAAYCDSPSRIFMPKMGDEHLEFSSVAHLGYDKFRLGPLKPSFYVPSSSIPNLFVLTEAPHTGRAMGDKWYKNGLNLFFNVSEDVFEAFTSDSALENCEVYQDL